MNERKKKQRRCPDLEYLGRGSWSEPEFADYGVRPLYESIATVAASAAIEAGPPSAVGVFLRHIMRQLTLPHSLERISTAITGRILSVITSRARSADTIFLVQRRGKNDTRFNRVPGAFARNAKRTRRR